MNGGSLEHPCYTLNGPAPYPVVVAGPRERRQDKKGRKKGMRQGELTTSQIPVSRRGPYHDEWPLEEWPASLRPLVAATVSNAGLPVPSGPFLSSDVERAPDWVGESVVFRLEASLGPSWGRVPPSKALLEHGGLLGVEIRDAVVPDELPASCPATVRVWFQAGEQPLIAVLPSLSAEEKAVHAAYGLWHAILFAVQSFGRSDDPHGCGTFLTRSQLRLDEGFGFRMSHHRWCYAPDVFVQSVLLPERAVREVWPRTGDRSSLAQWFGVPVRLVEERREFLGGSLGGGVYW